MTINKEIGMKRHIRLAAAAAALSAALATGAAAQQFTMKFGTATPRGDQNFWMEEFKKAVEARAGGRIGIKLFPASQLGAIPRQIEGLQLGTVEAWIGPTSFLTGVESRYQVMDAPGLFADWEHAQRTVTHDSFRDEFLNLGEKKGVIGIGIYTSNPMSVVSRKTAIRKVEDFRGQKLRVLGSALEVEQMRALGAAGVPMPLVETLPALQRNAIDGVRSGIVVFVPFKYWTVSKQLTEIGDSYIVPVAFVSVRWWKTLPEDLRRIMLEEARKLDDVAYKYARKQHQLFRGLWTKNGGELIDFPEAERKKLLELSRDVGAKVAARDKGVKAAYDKLVAAAGTTRQ
jgi:TRAP-type C4-dicarboxylate transport system substrate-binding protein